MQKISVTIPEAAALTGIGKTSLYGLIREGKLPMHKLGSRSLILMDDLETLVRSLPTTNVTDTTGT